MIAPVVLSVGFALGAEAPPRVAVYGVTEGRDAANARPVLSIQGKGLKALKFFTLAPAEGPAVSPEVLSTGSKDLVLGLPGDTAPGAYTLSMADSQGRMLEIPVLIGNGEPVPGTVIARSLDAALRTDLDDAETLGGQGPSFYANAGNLLAGTLDPARFSAYADLQAEGKIGTGAGQVAAGDHDHADYLTAEAADSAYARRAFIGARVYMSGDSGDMTSFVDNPLLFDSEVFDTDNCHDNLTNTDRLICRTPGYYMVGAKVYAEHQLNGTLGIFKNGTLDARVGTVTVNVSGSRQSLNLATVTYLAEGDILQAAYGEQLSNVTRTLTGGQGNTEFWMYRVGE